MAAKKKPRRAPLQSTTAAFNKFIANEKRAGREVNPNDRRRILNQLKKSASGKAVNPNKKR